MDLASFASKSSITRLSSQETYFLVPTVQNTNSYDRLHNGVSVVQQGYSLMECFVDHPKTSTSLAQIL
jgi:hypothetical protein